MFRQKYLLFNLLDADGGTGGGDGGSGDGGKGGAGDGAGGDASKGGAGGNSGGAPDFKALVGSLPDELKNDPSMKSITSLEGLTKSFIHAQKHIGKDKIALPDKHATRDDYRAILGKLGVPEKIEDYKFNLPKDMKDDTPFFGKFKEAAHKAGMLPWQAEELISWYEAESKATMEAAETEYKEEVKKQVGELQKEWGESFKTQVARANVTLKELLPKQEHRQALIDAGFGNNPQVMRLLANASKLLKEDVFVGQGAGDLTGMTAAQALEKARAIMGDAKHPYRDKTHPNHEAAKKEVAGLYKTAFPDGN